MIQELLGGGATSLLGGDHRKISNNINSCGGILQGPITSTTTTPTTTTITTNSTTTTSSATTPNTTSSTTPNTSEQQNLRCPRCDSSNTKFCYYNNYNLTQPRHFCKTCRRYWTKGGALRNVPIGGGCRKNKSTTSSSSVTSAKAGATGMKVKSGSTDIIKSTLGFDHDQSPNPILWASPHNSHLLALLRATTQNPNPNPNSVIIKEEGSLLASTINGSSHLNSSTSSSSEAAVMALNSSDLPIGLCSTSWRNLNLNNHHHHHHQQQQVQYHHHHQQQQQQYHHGLLSTSEVQNSSSSGLHELYQRLRSASSNYQTDHHHHHQSPTFLTNNSFCSSSPSTALDPSPISGADHLAGYWNPAFSSSAAWSNLSTTNGAFP
ncbi:hypothetical protein Syun_015547 [Stephania yunnanensis]|uniref:Dof zinc finger protein n=1 Tax=Stephania yunnanensis TaxID=152371 RepID=A0AAP0JNR3_9MAGN